MYVYQADDSERIATYKSFIRSTFAQGRSVFFCVPTIGHVDRVVASLGKGIDQYMFILHSRISSKEIRERWKALLRENHPVLVVGTPSFLGVPRNDLGALILDFENAKPYKQSVRPFLDARAFAERYAQQAKLTLILGDVLLRTETLARHERGELAEFAPIKFRVLSNAKKEVLDMQSIVDSEGERQFRILSDQLLDLARLTKTESGNLLVVANRKGLNPITLCADCGTVVRCTNCSAPAALHTRDQKRTFICHKCGARRDAHERCATCDSWRLTPLGIGTELVEEEFKRLLPDMTVMRLDGETATTTKRAQTMMAKFFDTPGSILVATEMVIPYLTQNVDRIAVASIDSLFALPDYRVNERVFNLLLRLYVRASKHFVVQTRHSGSERLFDYIARGNVIDFYRTELEERKSMGYPPFKTFIKVTCEGKRDDVRMKMEDLSNTLESYDAITYPAFTQEIRGKYRMHALIKLDQGKWVDDELLSILRALPPAFLVNVDPEDLL
jgi:primosomal protein N' (replication factor Y)